jgi:hypothetical protein
MKKAVLHCSITARIWCSALLSVPQGIRMQATSAAVMPPKLKQIVGQFQMVSRLRHKQGLDRPIVHRIWSRLTMMLPCN